MKERFEMYIKLSIIISVISLLVGFILNKPLITYGLGISLIVSAISNFLLYRVSLKVVYENSNIFIFLLYFGIRFILYFITLFLIIKIYSKKGYSNLKETLVLSCISFLSFKIFVYLERIIKKLKKGGNDENKGK